MLDPLILQQTQSHFTLERAWSILETLANTHAPSQTVSCTRTPVIRQILQKEGVPVSSLFPDYEKTGTTLLKFGDGQIHKLVFAHADEISYLVPPQATGGTIALVPFCKHLSQIEVDGVALRFSPQEKTMAVTAEGTILPPVVGKDMNPSFRVLTGNVKSGDRVVYNYPMQRTGDRVFGSIDNAAGVTACLMAAIAIFHTHPELPLAFVFTDEEEGPAGQNTSFSRGARQLLHRIPIPDLCMVVDGHPAPDESVFGQGAFFAGFSGGAASAVTTPPLFNAFQVLIPHFLSAGIRIHENTSPVSRGDEIAIIEYTSRILLFGYPSNNRHFDQAPPQMDLTDLVELAKTIYWTLCKLNL